MKLSKGILIVAATSLVSTLAWSTPTDHTDLYQHQRQYQTHSRSKSSYTKTHHAFHAVRYHLGTSSLLSSNPNSRHYCHHKKNLVNQHIHVYRLQPMLGKSHKKYIMVLDKHGKHHVSLAHYHHHHLALKWLFIIRETVGNMFGKVRRTVIQVLFA
ncbi:hypothetical protein IWQ61_001219 [Dispira simplex]|nr:hypothetical protein IWQ61_001219 [Dispira simplex]